MSPFELGYPRKVYLYPRETLYIAELYYKGVLEASKMFSNQVVFKNTFVVVICFH